MGRAERMTRCESIFQVEYFLTSAGCQRPIYILVDGVTQQTRRTVSECEIRSDAMETTEILKVAVAVVGDMIRRADDSGERFINVTHRANPTDPTVIVAPLADHDRVALSVSYVAQSNPAVPKKQAIAIHRVILNLVASKNPRITAAPDDQIRR